MTVNSIDLNIGNPETVKNKIVGSTKNAVNTRQANGLLVIFSGQNDSFTATKLAIESVGIDSVKLVVLSDVSEERRNTISSIATKSLSIPTKNIILFNIMKISKQFDKVEGLIPEIMGDIPLSRQHNISHLLLRTDLVRQIIVQKTFTHVGKTKPGREEFFQQVIAKSKVRKRLKILLAFLIAERENLLLMSKTNKTEWLTGLFTSFGYGHASDIMPLGDLYRTQVLQLGEYLGVPKEIRDLAYTDIMPGVQNKYQYFFELESNFVDEILVRLVEGWQTDRITEDLKISHEKVERVNHFYQVSKFQRKIPIIPMV